MEISREAILQYVEKPGFSAVIDMLIDAGLLAGQWTADDLIRALERYETRFEIVSLFGSEPANDQFAEAAFQARLTRWEDREVDRAANAMNKRRWRKNPANLQSEKANDKHRHIKLTRQRRLARKRARSKFLEQQQKDLKARLKSRISHLTQAKSSKRNAVGCRWDKSANQAIA